MRVEQGVEVARGVVPEGRDDALLVPRPDHPPGPGLAHPGLGDVFLHPGEGARHGDLVGPYRAPVAAQVDQQRDGLGRREGEVAAGTVVDDAVLAPLPEPLSRTVRHHAL